MSNTGVFVFNDTMLFGSEVYDALHINYLLTTILCPGKQQLIHHISVLVRFRRKNHSVRVRKRLCVDFRGSGLGLGFQHL